MVRAVRDDKLDSVAARVGRSLKHLLTIILGLFIWKAPKEATKVVVVKLSIWNLSLYISVCLMIIFIIAPLTDFLTSQGFDISSYLKALFYASGLFVKMQYVLCGLPIIAYIAMNKIYMQSESSKTKVIKALFLIRTVLAVLLLVVLYSIWSGFAVFWTPGDLDF